MNLPLSPKDENNPDFSFFGLRGLFLPALANFFLVSMGSETLALGVYWVHWGDSLLECISATSTANGLADCILHTYIVERATG